MAGFWNKAARAGLAAALLALCALVSPALAQTAIETPVDLQLVLAVDASGSVDQARFELQKQGYAAAFRNPRVLRAIAASPLRAIAVTMMQWTGPELHVVVVDWTLIDSERAAAVFADAIDRAPRALFGGGTSLSGAIDYAMILLGQAKFRGTRRVIDVSGDGSNNRGRPATQARDAAVRAGVGINGLPILALEPDLDKYYRDNVIGGPTAFVIPVTRYEDFADAILNKLVTEIASRDGRRYSAR